MTSPTLSTTLTVSICVATSRAGRALGGAQRGAFMQMGAGSILIDSVAPARVSAEAPRGQEFLLMDHRLQVGGSQGRCARTISD